MSPGSGFQRTGRSLGAAIGLMFVLEARIILGFILNDFAVQGASVLFGALAASLAALTPMVAIGGRRILLSSTIVNTAWGSAALVAGIMFLAGGNWLIGVYGLYAALMSLVIAVLTYWAFNHRKV